jgi:phospho-N-acetylmuramoyl-pentapeptide-transferase
MMTVIWGGPFIRLLHVLKIGKMIRIDGPDTHMLKMGTPTMGGIMFIIPTLLVNAMLNAASLLGVNIMGQTFVLPMITLILYALLGSIDDWEGIRGPRRGLGMRAKTKFLLQIIIAIFLAWIMKHYLNVSYIYWPNYQFPIDLGNWFIPIAVFFIVGMSNAINLTDGLDGLAGLISATAFAGYGAIALMVGQTYVGRFCFILVGALFGFLWFNVNPAELFMGDCGSLALGATLAVVALLTGHILVLPIIAIIPVSEALSDILQVGYFKYTHGKRLFRMAPLHHHFELLGWSEVQVVQRFWLVSLLFLMLGFAIAML